MEELIDMIKSKANILRFGKPHEKDNALGDIYNALEKLEQHTDYISVEDRLPKSYEDVNFAWENNQGKVYVTSGAYFDNHIKYWFDKCNGRKRINVTHWQPLPKPPKTK